MGIKYLTDPDFLARRTCEVTKEMPVEFIQNFYSMSEGELLGKKSEEPSNFFLNWIRFFLG